jgi:pantothenate synthetase
MADEAASGTRAAEMLKDAGLRILREADLVVDYLEIVDADTMAARADVSGEPALAVAAVRLGATRLLDNRWIVAPDGATTS